MSSSIDFLLSLVLNYTTQWTYLKKESSMSKARKPKEGSKAEEKKESKPFERKEDKGKKKSKGKK